MIKQNNINKLFVYFYEAGCSGKKVDIKLQDFSTNDLEVLQVINDIEIYVLPSEKKFLEDATIMRTIKTDHTWKAKTRYIYSSSEVKDRCGCGTSFNFEKKKPSFDLSQLQELKAKFAK